MGDSVRDEWDGQAATFDEEPDHGLRDPRVRRAWARLLLPLLPDPPASVVDLGCGTGSLSVVLAAAGHRVLGLDLSGAMLERARAKARAQRVRVDFGQADAGRPPVAPGSVDVVLARHLLWAFADPDPVLAAWVALLHPGGRLVLVEGRWSTGAGLPARDCVELVRRHRQDVRLELLDDPVLWGGPITDERYLVHSRR